LLKGDVLEQLDNRGLASAAYQEALKLDTLCAGAFNALTGHDLLSAAEEAALVRSLPLAEQCGGEEGSDLARLVTQLYSVSRKKYPKPSEAEADGQCEDVEAALSSGNMLALLGPSDTHLATHRAERHFYNCDYHKCFKGTMNVLREDPFHPQCLPLHISCLIELNKANGGV